MNESKLPLLATIDEALELSGFGKFNYLIIFLTGLVMNNAYQESIGINFALPVLNCDLHLTYTQQGILGSVGFIGIIASSHLWGFLADTQGRKRIMQPALFIGFLITIISSFSPNFEMLITTRFLSGFMLSAGSATVFAYLGEFHSQRYRNRAMFSAACISAFSAIFSPVIAWFYINQSWEFYVPFIDIMYKPWRLYILASGGSGFICGLILFCLPESPKYLLSAGREDNALAVIKQIYQKNQRTYFSKSDQINNFNLIGLIQTEDTPSKLSQNSCHKNKVTSLMLSMWHQTAPLFKHEHLKKTVLTSFIQFIIFFSAHGVFIWFPYIINSTMQFTQHHSSSLSLCEIVEFTQRTNFNMTENKLKPECVHHLELSTYWHAIMFEIIYFSLMLCVSYAIGKFGRKSILFVVFLVTGISGILAVVIKIPLVAIYLFVILLCCGVGTTVVNAIVVDIFPTNLRAMAVCISLMVGRIGSVTGSSVLGALIENSCNAALYGSAGSLLIAGCVSVFLPKPKSFQIKNNERIYAVQD